MLADLARAAGEIQDSLGGQGTELRTASEQVARQSADVRMIREELAVIEQRTRQWIPGSGGPDQGHPRWTGGCPYRGLLPYDQAHEAVFYGRERLTATLAGTLAQAGIVMVTGASGAGKTSLLQAGLVPALARGVQVPGSSSWFRVSMTPGTRPLTELSAQLAQLGDRDPAVIRKGLADAPGDAHRCSATSSRRPARLVLIIDQFEQVFAAAGKGRRNGPRSSRRCARRRPGRPGPGASLQRWRCSRFAGTTGTGVPASPSSSGRHAGRPDRRRPDGRRRPAPRDHRAGRGERAGRRTGPGRHHPGRSALGRRRSPRQRRAPVRCSPRPWC